MRAERRNITVTNERVSDALNQSENASKFIEKCILFYLDTHEKGYVTQEELSAILETQDKKFEKVNSNYQQVLGILDQIYKTLFPKKTD